MNASGYEGDVVIDNLSDAVEALWLEWKRKEDEALAILLLVM
jgi:hypothetical protein